MKEKIFIFLIIFFLILSGNNILFPQILSQCNDSSRNVPRTILMELFVQGGCTTCPTAEFCLEDLAWEYGTTKIILVEEHLWGDGYDTPETNDRYNWYVGDSKKGTPDLFIDGLTKRFQGLSCDCVEGNFECYKDAIDEQLTRPSFLELSASQNIVELDGIIKGTVKNISDIPLRDLVVCGMVGEEKDEPGLYFYIQDILPFQNMPTLLPGATFDFNFVPGIPFFMESEIDGEEDVSHLVIFVQNLETKEVLQALYIE